MTDRPNQHVGEERGAAGGLGSENGGLAPDEGLDSVDRSSADSFPASDPPATTGSADLPEVPYGRRLSRIDPVQLQKLLGGVDYPADKSTLVEKARENGADDRALQVLEALPVGRFNGPDDVSEAVGNAT